MHTIASEHELLVEDLRTAFKNESNAHLRYLEFAEKADGEGWHGIASLFRAVAQAEEVHAANHGRILRQITGDVNVQPAFIDVETTIENVRTAMSNEVFELDIMYPAHLQQAREARDVAMVRTFTWALAAEKTHARLFNEALALLEIEDEDSWITMARDFHVCPVCGYTSESVDEDQTCPTCFCSERRFEVIR